MEIYQRNINSIVRRIGKGRILVEASLLDLDHSARVFLTFDIQGRTIVEARAEMPKTPFAICTETLGQLPSLVGLVVERGVVRKVAQRLGRERGCVHLVELAVHAIRLASAALVAESLGIDSRDFAKLSEEERLRLGRPYLRNTCYAYNEERLKEVLD
jgi:hypothetical protein